MRAFLLALILCGASVTAVDAQSPADNRPAFAGASACASCHEDVYDAWSGSHHSWAWRSSEPANVLGDFDDAVFDHNGVTSRFSRRGDEFFVSTDGPDGETAEYRITHTVGVAPLQQYLVETEPGRLQALDLVWNVEKERWYNLVSRSGPEGRRRPALDRTVQELERSVRRVSCHGLSEELRSTEQEFCEHSSRDRGDVARPVTGRARRTSP